MSLGGNVSYRTLVESKEFSEVAKKLGEPKDVDNATCAITWALSCKPEVYPIVTGFRKLRVIRDRYANGEKSNEATIRMFYIIRDKDHVDLMYIEKFSHYSAFRLHSET